MALTLAEAEKFTTNMVKRGVLKTLISDSIVLTKLPFIDVVGNAFQYLREATLGAGTWLDPNESWAAAEATPTFTQFTATLKILGGDADIDEFLKATRSDKTDLEAEVIEARAKGIRNTFLDTFYYGTGTLKTFAGLHTIAAGADMTAQNVHQGAAAVGAPLSIANLDLLVDLVRDGKADCLLTTRNIRRRLTQYLRTQGSVATDRDEWGMWYLSHNEVPIYIDDFLVQTEQITTSAYSAKTGGVTGSIFAVRFGSNDLTGLQNGGLSTKKLGQLEGKDAIRWRIKWYPGLALLRNISMARLDGITDAAVVA